MQVLAAHTNRHDRRAEPKRIAATVDDTCHITGLGRTKVYELIGQGRLTAIAIGRRRLILMESIEALLKPGAP
jgi:excisionase family DNA binding protein